MRKEIINPGRWTEVSLDALLRESSGISDAGERIAFLSQQFLGTDYRESTLAGSMDTPETLVMHLGTVDCFTFIDYIEAMRLSTSFAGFAENLIRVRYRSGKVSFETRNHFFTDWIASNAEFVEDATVQAGGDKALRVEKELNRKGDGTFFLEGIAAARRGIHYIPSEAVDGAVSAGLRTGDYIGIYSLAPGLDVSHVGIFIKNGNKSCLRHASSTKEHRKVIDQDFMGYIADKPGIIILRPKK